MFRPFSIGKVMRSPIGVKPDRGCLTPLILEAIDGNNEDRNGRP